MLRLAGCGLPRLTPHPPHAVLCALSASLPLQSSDDIYLYSSSSQTSSEQAQTSDGKSGEDASPGFFQTLFKDLSQGSSQDSAQDSSGGYSGGYSGGDSGGFSGGDSGGGSD